jgi:hypothetical protein
MAEDEDFYRAPFREQDLRREQEAVRWTFVSLMLN